MKVVFLDIDGVLNNESTSYIFEYNFPKRSHYNEPCADATCVRLMEILLLKSGANIVISSSWRLGLDKDQLQDVLREQFGFNLYNRVIDKTDNFFAVGETRGHQIQRWLDQHPEVTHHVIVDDGADACLEESSHNFELIDARFGFQVNNMLNCLDILQVERK